MAAIEAPAVPDEVAEAVALAVAPDVTLPLYVWRDRPAQPDAPLLVFTHANGFNVGCYEPFLRRLAGAFQIVGFDQRGHGAASVLPADRPGAYEMDCFAGDLGRIVDWLTARFGTDRPWHYVAHSLGGLAALVLAGEQGREPWRTMSLFEPPIYPPAGHPLHPISQKTQERFVAWAARRPRFYASKPAFRAVLDGIAGYARFAPEMKAALLATGRERGDGRIELRCPGPVEAEVYRRCSNDRAFDAAAHVRAPVLLLASDAGPGSGHSWAAQFMHDIAARLPRGTRQAVAGCGHLMIQEAPDTCAEIVRAHIAAHAAAT